MPCVCSCRRKWHMQRSPGLDPTPPAHPSPTPLPPGHHCGIMPATAAHRNSRSAVPGNQPRPLRQPAACVPPCCPQPASAACRLSRRLRCCLPPEPAPFPAPPLPLPTAPVSTEEISIEMGTDFKSFLYFATQTVSGQRALAHTHAHKCVFARLPTYMCVCVRVYVCVAF